MSKNFRLKSLNQLIQKELAQLIEQEFAPHFVTVTEVETTPDLLNAKVWIAVFQDSPEEILKQLENRRSEFQSILGKKLFIKNIPCLHFLLDHSAAKVARIEKLLKEGR
jgi:ribosome-binding factor A